MQRKNRLKTGKWFSALAGVMALGWSGCGQDLESKADAFLAKMEAPQAEVAQALGAVDDTAPIVFVAIRDGQAQLFAISLDGQNLRQLTTSPGYKCRPAWNTSHTQIAFFHYAEDRPIKNEVAVELINQDGGGSKVLLESAKINPRTAHLSWNPGGTLVFFAEADTPTAFTGVDVATGQRDVTMRIPNKSFLTEIHTLSRDLRMMAGFGPAKDKKSVHLGTVGRDGESDTDLLMPLGQKLERLGPAIFSYNSQLVAFEADEAVMVMCSRFTMRIIAYPITPMEMRAELSSPSFSPTGKHLVCVLDKSREGQVGSGDQEVDSDLFVMLANGTQQKKITQLGTAFDPTW